MIKLYTSDATQDCDLWPYKSEAAATAAFSAGRTITGWQETDFGDCWVKAYNRPHITKAGYVNINGIKCTVRHPGHHPGGNCYWLTPVLPVMTPVWADENAE